MARTAAQVAFPTWLRNRWKVWARRNNLELWTFNLEMFTTMRNTAAETNWTSGYHNADISFSKENYDRLNEEEADLLINHEQFHLFTAHQSDAMGKLFGHGSQVMKVYLDEQERLADAFAHVMVKAYKRKRTP